MQENISAESLRYNLFVSLQSCHNLPARKQHGTSDPFVKFVVGNKVVHKTRTVKGELNPVWEDEVFVVVLAELASPLEVSLGHSHWSRSETRLCSDWLDHGVACDFHAQKESIMGALMT